MLNIKIIGSGCPNCQKLEALCREVAAENNIETIFEKVTNVIQFADLGIMMTPGLIVNNKVLSQGKIPTKSTLAHWLIDNER
jgi:small redox-active disulfide protein 2